MATNSSVFRSCNDVAAFTVVKGLYTSLRFLLLVPLSIFVLVLGYRRRRSGGSTSHVDVFTLQVAVLELVCGLGSVCGICALYDPSCQLMEYYSFTLSYNGEALFHVLTCVERYLAVVHPVTYRGLRSSRGMRIRNVTVGLVWVLCFAWSSAVLQKDLLQAAILFYWISAVSLVTVSFLSVSVLCVLVRPGPGKGGGGKECVDRLKQRAFSTISAIFGVMVLWFLGVLVTSAVGQAPPLDLGVHCMVQAAGLFCSLPGGLLLSLLYLHRKRRPSPTVNDG